MGTHNRCKFLPHDKLPCHWKNLKPHPLSQMTDLDAGIMPGAMARHMRRFGYDSGEPITIYQGKILDGRRRHAEAIEAGEVPTFQEFEGRTGDAVAFVCKKLLRQHLNASQRAMLAAELCKILNDKDATSIATPEIFVPPGESFTQKDAAEMFGVSERALTNAAGIQDHGSPLLNGAVKDRTITIRDAAQVTGEEPEVQDAAVEAVKAGEAPTVAQAVTQATGEAPKKATRRKKPEDPKPTHDPAGQEVPDILRDALFDKTYQSVIESLEEIASDLGQVELKKLDDRLKWYPYLDMAAAREYMAEVKKNFHSLLEHIRMAQPTHVCPTCNGTGKLAGDIKCDGCRMGAGHVPAWRYQEALSISKIEAGVE